MSAHLLPCPSCHRHVRASSDTCPFCTFLLSDAFRSTPARALPLRRLGRAATFAFGAALAGATACGPHTATQQTGDQSGSVGEIYGGPPSPPPAPMPAPPSTPIDPHGSADPAYGAPPPMPVAPTPEPPAPPPPGPSGGAHSGLSPHLRREGPEDPGAVVALYGMPFDPEQQRIGAGDGIGVPPTTGAPAPAPAVTADSPRDRR